MATLDSLRNEFRAYAKSARKYGCKDFVEEVRTELVAIDNPTPQDWVSGACWVEECYRTSAAAAHENYMMYGSD